jgi:hypothetical protein
VPHYRVNVRTGSDAIVGRPQRGVGRNEVWPRGEASPLLAAYKHKIRFLKRNLRSAGEKPDLLAGLGIAVPEKTGFLVQQGQGRGEPLSRSGKLTGVAPYVQHPAGIGQGFQQNTEHFLRAVNHVKAVFPLYRFHHRSLSSRD